MNAPSVKSKIPSHKPVIIETKRIDKWKKRRIRAKSVKLCIEFTPCIGNWHALFLLGTIPLALSMCMRNPLINLGMSIVEVKIIFSIFLQIVVLTSPSK